ncbi:amidohydrolase [Azospirillum sp. 412522]|nr:amidohydrolase family protein [Azospirillum sp. 412522]MBY6264409.1 amidohydrolase [Azospirillum sp. 412522]
MPRAKAIALEEHFAHPELVERYGIAGPAQALTSPLENRLPDMDAAGIGIQVLSHAPSAAQSLPALEACSWAEKINDHLAAAIEGNPRFAGFASLPMTAPDAAARELTRTVETLGFRGAMLHGLTNGVFPDHESHFPLYAEAERLGVPIYLHPSFPHPEVMRAYYADWTARFPMFGMAAAGFTAETMVIAIRMMLGRIPELFPRLQLILGHMGEAIPFLLERIDESLARDNGGERFFRERFLRHFHITTSGNFSDAALICALTEMGVGRIMFSVDWPYVSNRAGRDWIDAAPLSEQQRSQILYGNAQRLLRLP